MSNLASSPKPELFWEQAKQVAAQSSSLLWGGKPPVTAAGFVVDRTWESQTCCRSSSRVTVKGCGWWLLLSGDAVDWWSPPHPPSSVAAGTEIPAPLHTLLPHSPSSYLSLQVGDMPQPASSPCAVGWQCSLLSLCKLWPQL